MFVFATGMPRNGQVRLKYKRERLRSRLHVRLEKPSWAIQIKNRVPGPSARYYGLGGNTEQVSDNWGERNRGGFSPSHGAGVKPKTLRGSNQAAAANVQSFSCENGSLKRHKRLIL